MPVLKVHISSAEAPANKPLLAKRLRDVMIEKLQISEKIGQVILYETSPQHRVVHSEKCNNFVFIEVLIYPGRSPAMKQSLMIALIQEVSGILKIDISDIDCCLQEIPQDNWFEGVS
jgi:phenylpyruvate tautomerase PptA (4-oxalocrotonate tautomerase family)